MSCRCSDIRNCSRDLSVLHSALRQIGTICRSCGELQQDQERIQNWEFQVFELDSNVRESDRQKLMKREAQAKEEMEKSERAVEQLISRLERELSHMEREDERYHDDDDDDD